MLARRHRSYIHALVGGRSFVQVPLETECRQHSKTISGLTLVRTAAPLQDEASVAPTKLAGLAFRFVTAKVLKPPNTKVQTSTCSKDE